MSSNAEGTASVLRKATKNEDSRSFRPVESLKYAHPLCDHRYETATVSEMQIKWTATT